MKFILSQTSFELPVYTAQVDGIGTLNMLEAIRQSGLETTCKFYQVKSSLHTFAGFFLPLCSRCDTKTENQINIKTENQNSMYLHEYGRHLTTQARASCSAHTHIKTGEKTALTCMNMDAF